MMKAEAVESSTLTKNLPTGWRWARLGEVCEFSYGSGLPSKVRQEGGVPVYGSNGIVGYHNQALTQGPTIIIGRKGSIGQVHLSQEPCWPIDTTYFIEHPKLDVDLKWLSYWLRALHLDELNKAAAIPGLNRDDAYALKISLPPLAEQQRIVAILNGQMAAVQKAKGATEAQLKAAKDLPSAYLRTVFETSEAQKWPTTTLGQVSELLPSKSISSGGDTQVLAITTACLTENGFQPSGVKVARMYQQDALECHVSKGEVLVARSNTANLVGRVAMFSGEPEGAVASDLTIRICPRQAILPLFLTAYLSFLFVSGYWRERAGGASSSMKKITRTQILDLQVPLPSLPEQQQIATHLAKQLENTERARKILEEQLDVIGKLPAMLLQRAFAGEV